MVKYLIDCTNTVVSLNTIANTILGKKKKLQMEKVIKIDVYSCG